MSASPYKSRLFNLLNRRSLRLKDQLGRATRRVKNAAALGLQILLYPIYLLVQSARMAGTQLGRTVQKQLSPPTHTPTDAIEQLLATVTATETSLTGIATDLDTHHLQIVANYHQTLAILGDSDRDKLERQIRTALANYSYEKRREERLNRKYTRLLPAFTPKNQNVIPPIRWLVQLFRWQQTGKVAIAINLFGESSLVASRPSLPLPNDIEPLLKPILEVIDHQLANLEARALIHRPETPETLTRSSPVSLEIPSKSPDTSRSYGWRVYWLIYEAIDHFTRRGATPIADSLELSLPQTSALAHPLPEKIKEIRREVRQSLQQWLENQGRDDPFAVQKLIQAAIEYFFPPSTNLALAPRDDDPWLDWEDLFTATNDSPRTPEKRDIPPASLPSSPRPSTLRAGKHTKKALRQESKPKSLQKRTSAPKAIIRSEPHSETKPTTTPSIQREIIEPIAEEWLETKSTPVGYVKHPLERVLDWLDAIILWVEELILKIWRWFNPRRPQRKSRRNRRDK